MLTGICARTTSTYTQPLNTFPCHRCTISHKSYPTLSNIFTKDFLIDYLILYVTVHFFSRSSQLSCKRIVAPNAIRVWNASRSASQYTACPTTATYQSRQTSTSSSITLQLDDLMRLSTCEKSALGNSILYIEVQKLIFDNICGSIKVPLFDNRWLYQNLYIELHFFCSQLLHFEHSDDKSIDRSIASHFQ